MQTLNELEAAWPDGVVEVKADGEVVIYTNLSPPFGNPNVPLVEWCEVCLSGSEVPEDGCDECGRGQRRTETVAGGPLAGQEPHGQ